MKKKSNILIVFGTRVREKRLKMEMSQENLASKAQMHRTYIGMIERAEKNITLENMEKIAQALDLPISSLLQNEND